MASQRLNGKGEYCEDNYNSESLIVKIKVKGIYDLTEI